MNTVRYIARFLLEADTPLFVGSGNSTLLKDAIVQKDINDLPMIPGTTIAGVLRHSLSDYKWVDKIFGSLADNGKSSILKVSSAYMLVKEDLVSEGIMENISSDIIQIFQNLPVRQHVKISDKGTAVTNGLFDNEIVYKGTRFVFEIELCSDNKDVDIWNIIITKLLDPTFRLGAGTRKGYGSLKVLSYFNRCFDLTLQNDFYDYINYDPSFNSGLKLDNVEKSEFKDNSLYQHYRLKLKPDLFFIFSEGSGDDEVDNRPISEDVASYEDGKIELKKMTLIPASSIKGAISHRTAYYDNKINGRFVDNLDNEGLTGTENSTIVELFGVEAGKNSKNAQAGNVYINDIYVEDISITNDKIFNHVAIDRFTGGAIEGALFSEKVSFYNEDLLELDIYVKNPKDNAVLEPFEEALKDICKGLLPLGGMTTKGHGMFTGSLLRNKKLIFPIMP